MILIEPACWTKHSLDGLHCLTTDMLIFAQCPTCRFIFKYTFIIQSWQIILDGYWNFSNIRFGLLLVFGLWCCEEMTIQWGYYPNREDLKGIDDKWTREILLLPWVSLQILSSMRGHICTYALTCPPWYNDAALLDEQVVWYCSIGNGQILSHYRRLTLAKY